MRSVLVTGGAGFIGSHIVDALVARGDEVVVVDNLDPAAHAARPAYLNAGARYVWDDLCDDGVWESVLPGVDTVCHQAGKVGLGVDFGDCAAYVAQNDLAWARGLRAMHEHGFTGSIVLASSMVVYGEGRYRCPSDGIVTPAPRRADDLAAGRFEPTCPSCGSALLAELVPETASLDPRNVYAATKLHQEHLLAAFSREHDVPATSLRYHNVYGPRMPRDTPYAGVAAIFRSALERGERPMVTEDGRQMRNFVHVEDVAAANLAAIDRAAIDRAGIDRAGADGAGLEQAGHRAFNVASAEPHTVGEMAEALAAAFGEAPGSARWPHVTGRYRLGDVRHVFASTEMAAADLGYRASVSFADGIFRFARAELREPVRQGTGIR